LETRIAIAWDASILDYLLHKANYEGTFPEAQQLALICIEAINMIVSNCLERENNESNNTNNSNDTRAPDYFEQIDKLINDYRTRNSIFNPNAYHHTRLRDNEANPIATPVPASDPAPPSRRRSQIAFSDDDQERTFVKRPRYIRPRRQPPTPQTIGRPTRRIQEARLERLRQLGLIDDSDNDQAAGPVASTPDAAPSAPNPDDARNFRVP
jgi:hypothetical protein